MDRRQKKTTESSQNNKIPRNYISKKRKKPSENVSHISKRPKRAQNKPDRYGKRLSASNRDEFFQQILSSSDSDDTNNAQVPNNEINLVESSDSSGESVLESCHNTSNGRVNVEQNQRTPIHERCDVPVSESSSEFELISSGSSSDEMMNVEQHTRTSMLEIGSVLSELDEFNGRQTSTTDDRTILSKLDEILARVSLIEKNTAKMEVRLRNIEAIAESGVNLAGNIQNDHTSFEDLTQLGLPVENQASLDKLAVK